MEEESGDSIVPETVMDSVRRTSADLQRVSSCLPEFLSLTDPDVLADLQPLRRAQCMLVLAKSATTLLSLRLRCMGINPADHPIKSELERISLYEAKLERFMGLNKEPLRPSTSLNYQAATRFIEHSLPDLTPDVCCRSKEEYEGYKQMCNVACWITLDKKHAKYLEEKIKDEYRVNMILDNLPLVVPIQREDRESPPIYEHGFHSKEEKYFIHNHLAFTVKYHRDVQTDMARIMGFEVKPFSIKHEYEGQWSNKTRLITCDPYSKHTVVNSNNPQEVEESKEIVFTYDVEFQESDLKWASRWDAYLLMSDDQVHWFSILNALMNVLLFSGMVAIKMSRALYGDISKYNELETQEGTGWKLVHGDVFRPPSHSDLLCIYVGFLGMILVTMIFAFLGFLSPSNRGVLMTAMLLLWVFMGLFGGYSSARLYKMFKGTEWKRVALRTALMFPAIAFAILFVLNGLIWGQKSSGAVPFGTMFALVFLWFGISVPLVFAGSYIGSKNPAMVDPVKTNEIPRQIPEQAWYMNPAFSVLIGGVLPFGAVFIELFFILTSIWLNQFYFLGFLFLVFITLVITCAEITVVLCYFQLCSEDYLWWWRSYLTSGSSALYLFLYATFYFYTKLEITKLVLVILYFGYVLIISYAFFTFTGTIGFCACFWFTRLIYSSVKID